jgi:hypothetical protein
LDLIVTIDYDRQADVPYEVLEYCDSFTLDTQRNDLRYIDCVYMNMGEYGNDLEQLKEMRQRILPIFE